MAVLKDLAYGTHERHRMDLYIPQTPRCTSGVVLYIHGGGWSSGDKTAHTKDVEYWYSKGYIACSINYRYVTQELNVSDELDDVTEALKMVKEKCAAYGFSVENLLLSGGSAGAHLCLMYVCTRGKTAPLHPVAVFCCCPPLNCADTNFLLGASGEFEGWKYEILSQCAGVKITKDTYETEKIQKALKTISPLFHMSGYVVPTMVCHGKKDELVPFEQSLEWMDVLEKKGIPHGLIPYAQSGHALDKDPETDLMARERMEEYIEKYLCK